MDGSPAFANVQAGMLLGAMYGGNVLCALASAKEHGAVGHRGIGAAAAALNVAYGVLPVAVCWMEPGFVQAYAAALAA